MRLLAIALLLLSSSAALAAEAQPQPQMQIKPTDQFTVTLQAQGWDAVIRSVHDSDVLSARDANSLESAIRQQIMAKAPSQKK